MLVSCGRSWTVQEITHSRIYPAYCIDVFLNMSILFLALMCNLYLAFVAGTSVQDVLAKLVILNFILEQQNRFKQEIFKGNTGRIVLQAIRNSYEYGAPAALASVQYRGLVNLYGKEVTVRKRLMKSYTILDRPPSKEEEEKFALCKRAYEKDVTTEMDKHYEKIAEQQMRKEGWRVKQARQNIERIETWERVVRSKADEVLQARDPRRAGDHREILMATDKNKAMQDFIRKMCREYMDAEQKNVDMVEKTLRDQQKPKEVDVYRKNIFEKTKRLAEDITFNSDKLEQMEDLIMRLNVAMIRVLLQQPESQYKRKYAFLSRREQLVANYKAAVAKVKLGMGQYATLLFTFKQNRLKENGVLRTIAEKSLLFLGVFPVWIASAFVIYAPICKPGPTWVISVNPTSKY